MKQEEAEQAFAQLTHLGAPRIILPGVFAQDAIAAFEGGMAHLSRKTRYAWAWPDIANFCGVVTHKKTKLYGIPVASSTKSRYEVTSTDDKTVSLNESFGEVDEFADLVDDGSFEHRLAFRLRQIQQFGYTTMSDPPFAIWARAEGLQYGKKVMIPWTSITGIRPGNGALLIDGTTTMGRETYISAMANEVDLRVLVEMITRYRQLTASQTGIAPPSG